VTQDKERRVIENAGVAIAEGRILAVGTWDEISSQYSGDELLPDRELLVMPGLVNAHTHAPMTLFRGLADDLPLMEWLQTYVFPSRSSGGGSVPPRTLCGGYPIRMQSKRSASWT